MLRIRGFIKKAIKWRAVGIALSVGVLLVLTSILSVFAANPNLPCDVGASEAVPPDACTIIAMYAADMGEDQYPGDLNLWNPVLEISGALWDYFPSDQASGTGVFNTYLAVKAPGNSLIERGYNTGVEKKDHVAYYDEDDAKTSVLPLSKVPVVDIDGTLYREFACDINEVSGLPDQLISLEVLQIWQTDEINIGDGTNLYSDPMSPDYEFSSLASLVYDLDCDENVTLIMDYGVNTGSGKPDYKVFIPNDWFDGSIENVIMVAVHGNLEEQNPSSKKDPNEYYGTGSSSGFEEWGVRVFEAQTGCLEITKDVNFSGVVNPTVINETFDVTVTGPSYPGGTHIYFNVVNGVLTGSPQTLSNLIPGSYTVAEADAGDEWTESVVTSPVDVLPGTSCATVTVNNVYVPGCLEITKSVNLSGVVNQGEIDETFTVHISGPGGYTNTITFTMVGGGITSPNPVVINNLAVGSYTITEDDAGPEWSESVTGSPASVEAGGTCAQVSVTNEYVPGCLTVHKAITGIAGVLGIIPDATFTVNVSGPSFSSPEVLTFHFSGGVITDNDQTLSLLIPGDYTVSEPGVPANWHLVGITPTQPINVAAGSSCATNTVTVTNDYDPGCLTITKELSIPVGVLTAPLDGTFIINVANVALGFSQNLTFTMTDGAVGGAQTINNLIPATYTLTEPGIPATPPGWSNLSGLGDVVVSSNVSCATREVVNKYQPGCLTITKTLQIPAEVPLGPLDGTFIINVANVALGFSQNLTFNMTNGVVSGAQTINNLIPGTYTLTEPGLPSYWAPTAGLGDVTVSSGAECAARTVTNTYTPGCLTITKELSIPGGVPLAELDGPFVINVANAAVGFSQNLTFNMTNGVVSGAQTINNLIPGTYTLTEPGLPSYWAPTAGLGDVTVSSGAECAARTVTNTYTPGCLTITKELSIPGGVPLAELDGPFVINVANAAVGFSQNLTFNMTNGVVSGAQTINNLIPGTYTLTEPGLPSYWAPTAGLGDVTVSSGAECAARTVTNTYTPGCLTITKELSIPGGVPLAELDGPFVINVANAAVGFSQNLTFNMTNGVISGPQTINNLIPGTYTLTEPGLPSYWAPTAGLGDVTVSSGAECAARTVTNTYTPGCLTITKELSIPGGVPLAELDGPFVINVANAAVGFSQNLTFNMTNGVVSGPQTINNLIPGTYTLTEPGLPSYWAPTAGLGDVTVSSGASCAARTVTNTFQTGCLRIVKSVDLTSVVGPISEIPDVDFIITVTGPSYLTGHNLTFNLVNGVISGAQDLSNLIPGNYTVVETPPAGWTKDSIVTSPALVSAGDACGDVVVTVTNSPDLGCLRIVKSVDLSSVTGPISEIPDVDFIITVTGPSYLTGHNLTFNLVNGVISGAQDLSNLIPGNYTVVETPPAGWTKDSIVTSPATVSAGDACGDVIVTVTNSPDLGCLRIVKSVDLRSVTGPIAEIPDVDFIITVTGPSYLTGHNLTFNLVNGVISGAQNLTNLIPGNYTVVETPPAGWTKDSIVTSPATVSAEDACGDVVVTVTNSPDLGCLQIVKSVDLSSVTGPISEIPDVDFIITVTGPSYLTGHNLTFNLVNGVISGAQNLTNLIPGNYTVVETPPAGWTKDSIVTSPATVSAEDACGDVVVTVTNSPDLGCLQIVKSVDLSSVTGPISEIPDVDFIITVTGPSYLTGHNLTFNLVNGVISGAQNLTNLIPGNYTVVETPPAGWTKDSIVTSPALVSAGDACGDVIVTVTNSPDLGCLQIVKSVDLSSVTGPISEIPDVDFIITVTGPSYLTGHNLTFNLVNGVISGAQDLSNLIPGNYTVVETPPAGWTKDSIVTSPALVSAGDACGDVIVTVTNSPDLGCLRIVKSVDLRSVTGPIAEIPDVDFIITVTGPSYLTGHNLTFNLVNGVISGAQNLTNLIPGNYTVVETPPAGWTKDSIVTSPATVSAEDACGDVVVTVTNSPDLGCLQIVKSVDLSSVTGPISEIPDVDFIITVTGPSYLTGHNLTFNLVNGVISGAQNLTNLIPGNYTVVETPPAGWTKDSIVTSPATVSAEDACGDVVVTVTNSPDLGCLQIVKSVDLSSVTGPISEIPDVDFIITVTGPSYLTGHNLTFNLVNGVISGAQNLTNLIPGNYTVVETPPAGWTKDSIVTSPALVSAGDACGDVIVTVTNSPDLGCLQIVKSVDLSSVTGPISEIPDVDFIITVTGPSYLTGHNLTFNLVNGVISGAQNLTNLIPGNYTVVETPPAGWTKDSIVTSPATVSAEDACGDVIVTVTNSPDLGCLQIVKSVDLSSVTGPISEIPDVDFIITVTGPSYLTGHNLTFNLVNGVISGAQNLTNLIPGNYTVVETPPAGWTKDSIVTSPATVSAEDACGDVIVTVTNSPDLGCLEVTKVVDLDDYMFKTSANSTFIVTVTGPSYLTGHNLTFNLVDGVVEYDDEGDATACLCGLIPGDYTVAEIAPDGWDDAIIAPAQPVTVAAGTECDIDAVVVTVTNTLLIPHTTMLEITYVYDSVSGNVTMNITDCNDGDAPITDAGVYLRANNATYPFSPMGRNSTYFQGGDDSPDNDILDPGECWTWVVNVTINGTTFFEAWGDGIDPLGNHVTYNPDTGEGYESEYQSVTIGPCWGDETAWAFGGDFANPNWDYVNNNNWGWTNNITANGTYVFPLYAGAGQNDITKGMLVGTVSVNYTGGCVNVTYELHEGYYLGETHLWVGNYALPKVGKTSVYTNAPGQFPFGVDYGFDPEDSGTWETEWSWSQCGFEGDIYVAAHGVVWMEVECEDNFVV